jgi:vitamin B12 transporter
MLTLLSSAHAQSTQSVDPVVVTATRTPQSIADTLPSTTILTRADIENSQSSDVLTLLRRQAGLEIAQTGGLGAQASVFMRGANSTQVLVLIDGLRINSVGSGAPLLADVMLDEIDHIEIVRGNVSSLYGSEAIGGVIQIFTRRSDGQAGGGVNLQVGGDKTQSIALHGGASFGQEGSKTTISGTVSTRSADGFSAIDPQRAVLANPDKDGYRNTSASVQLSQQIGQQEIGLHSYASQGKLDFDSSSEGPTQTQQERSKFNSTALYAQLHLTEAWSSKLQYGETEDRSVNTSSYAFSFLTGTTTNRSKELSWDNSYALAPTQTLTAGYDNLNQKGYSTSYGATFGRNVNSLLAGYVGRFGTDDAHRLQVNIRHDDYSDFGDADTGLAAYGYRFAADWKAIAQVSTAFRAPSFNDLYYPYYGNPKLKAERARSAELGLQYAKGKDSLRVSLFRTRIRDLIVYDPTIFIANNIARARVTGMELSGSTEWLGWELSANLTLQRPIDEISNQALLRRAHRNFNVAVAKAVGAWRFSAAAQDAGARYDSDINTFQRIELPSYTVADLGVRYTLNRDLTLGFSLTNAFDKHYYLVDGYNTAGRVATVSLAAKF